MRSLRFVVLAVGAVLVTWALGAGTASAHVPSCVESVNPHGQNTPPAGSTTLPGPNGGQNEDGFYKIGSDVGTDVFVVTGGVTFGPFPSGSVVKYTQAPGSTPTSKKIGSENGQAGAVITHITGPDELVVRSQDGRTVTCLVPPPPK
jgi:hypothetical protein